MEQFCNSVLRLSTLQLIQSTGFDRTSALGAEVLTDIFGRYIELLGKTAQESSVAAGRTTSNAFDALSTFDKLGIRLSDLEDWLSVEGEGKGDVGRSENDPSEVLKVLSSRITQDQTDQQLLSFVENPTNMNVDDEIDLFGEYSDENDDSDDREDEQEAEHNEDTNMNEENKEVELFDEEPITNNTRNSDDRLPHIPYYLPPFPTITLHQNSIDEQNVLISRGADGDDLPEKPSENNQASNHEWHDESVNENKLQKDIQAGRKKRSLTGVNSVPLKLVALDKFEKALNVLAASESSISATESPRKKRELDGPPSFFSSGETISFLSQNTSHDEIWREIEWASVPTDSLRLPKIEVAKRPRDEVVDITGYDANDGEFPMNDETASRNIAISRKRSQEAIAPIPLPPPSSLLSTRPGLTTTSRPKSAQRPITQLVKSPPSTETIPNQTQPTSQPSQKRHPKTKKTSRNKDVPAKTITSPTPQSSSSNKIALKIRISASKNSVPKPTSPPSAPASMQLPVPTFIPIPEMEKQVQEEQEVIDCICDTPNLDNHKFMIACDSCQVWYHGSCVGFGDEMQVVVDTWHCIKCRNKSDVNDVTLK